MKMKIGNMRFDPLARNDYYNRFNRKVITEKYFKREMQN
jgi:hypothetical protein